jgi:hypothetical protein
MNPLPRHQHNGKWVRATAKSAPLALLVAGALVSAQTAGPAVYRCGSSYSSTPCPGGNAVLTDDTRSAAQQREAEALKRREAALAEQLAAERHAREREAAAQPAVGIGPEAAASAPRHKNPAKKPKAFKIKQAKPKKPAAKPPAIGTR